MQAAPKIDNNITVIDGYNITFCHCFDGVIWDLYRTETLKRSLDFNVVISLQSMNFHVRDQTCPWNCIVTA